MVLQVPSNYFPGTDIHPYRQEIKFACNHWDVGNIAYPYLVDNFRKEQFPEMVGTNRIWMPAICSPGHKRQWLYSFEPIACKVLADLIGAYRHVLMMQLSHNS